MQHDPVDVSDSGASLLAATEKHQLLLKAQDIGVHIGGSVGEMTVKESGDAALSGLQQHTHDEPNPAPKTRLLRWVTSTFFFPFFASSPSGGVDAGSGSPGATVGGSSLGGAEALFDIPPNALAQSVRRSLALLPPASAAMWKRLCCDPSGGGEAPPSGVRC